MESVYLGQKGLTSSEANHVTNVTKELVKDLDSGLGDFQITSAVAKRHGEDLLLNDAKKINFEEQIMKKSKLYALSAWLKNGVKMKEKMLSNIQIERNKIVAPVVHSEPTEINTDFDSYLNSLTVRETNEYLTAETIAAHIGKFIHGFDDIRKLLDTFQPVIFHRISNDEVLTVKNTLLYTKEELLEKFFQLQKEHREAEKVVNNYKAKHKDWVKSVKDETSDKRRKIMAENDTMIAAYRREIFEEDERVAKAEREMRKLISDLKIVIPSDLQETLDEVNKYAKK